ncbi:hypothetical protein SDC9_154152 [bioreactor metagenome]|uniref:Uncharacterized protein n=1 Tax=bioreactor metagenome TaxID=1076179 RepID=A0A645EXX3_9ZZZZ
MTQACSRTGGDGGLPLDLPGDDDHRNRIDPGPHDSGDRVRSARTGRDARHAGHPGNPRIPLRPHGAGLFVEVADVAQPFFPAERIVEVHRPAAGDQKNQFRPPIGQKSEDVIGYAHVTLPLLRSAGWFRSYNRAFHRSCRGKGRSRKRCS